MKRSKNSKFGIILFGTSLWSYMDHRKNLLAIRTNQEVTWEWISSEIFDNRLWEKTEDFWIKVFLWYILP